ncbi:hypothetical protein ACROYT_G019082 [Oculina patagonica]
MATGGGDFGFEDPDLDQDLDHNSDNDDEEEQEVDTTRPFQPGEASTPYHGDEQHEMQTMQHEQSGLPDTSYEETPFLGSFIHQDDKPAMIDRAKGFYQKKIPQSELRKIKGPIGFKQKGSGNETTIVSFGPKGGETEILKKDGSGLLKKFTDKFKAALGPEAESLIAQENEEIRETNRRLRESEIQVQEGQKIASEKEKAIEEIEKKRIKIERNNAIIDQLGSAVENKSEVERLKLLNKNLEADVKNSEKEVAALEKLAKDKAKEQKKADQLRAVLAAQESKRNTLEENLNNTKGLDDLKEKEAEIKQQNEEDKKIIEDDNASPSEKQAAEDRVAERTEELGRLQTQIAERERALPLRERIKEIFKKHGVTLTAILLAAGVTIGSVIGAITNSLKATGKAAHLAAYPCCGCFSC